MKDNSMQFVLNHIEQNTKAHDYLLKRLDQLGDKIDKNQNDVLVELDKLNSKHFDNKVDIARLDVRAGIFGTLSSAIVSAIVYFINGK